jgi:hypothetical protein
MIMKKWKKVLLTLFVIGLISAIVVFYIITKKPLTAADSKPVKELTATELFNSLDSNFRFSDSIFNNQNIAVKGIVKEIDSTNKHVFIEAGEAKLINCSFDSVEFSKIKSNIKLGGGVNIKGIYTGCDGYNNADDGMDLIPSDKIAQLKTCSVNP